MVDFPEKIHRIKKLRIPAAAAVILALVSMASCSNGRILVISDPYVKILNGGNWEPDSFSFRLKSRIGGYPVKAADVKDAEALSDTIELMREDFDILVLSPFLAANMPATIPEGKRIIVAGGYAPGGADGIESVVPDRLQAMAEAADLAIRKTDGKVVLLVNRTTEARRRESEVLMESFSVSAPERELVLVDASNQKEEGVPDSFVSAAADAGLLILMAGSLNLQAMLLTDENAVPVITELAENSRIRKERVIASVEDSPGAFGKALRSQFASGGTEEQKTYPARLLRK